MRPTLALLAALGAAPASAEVPNVVADIAPVQSLVAAVMGDLGTPSLLLPPGASPHGHAMRPSEAQALQRADVIVWVGDALTPWLAKSLNTLGGEAEVVELLHGEGTTVLDFRQGPLFGAESAEGEQPPAAEPHDEGHEAGGHAHTGSGIDPHAWLDPENAKVWTTRIAAALAEADPGHAATYRANAEATLAELDALVGRIEARLAPVRPGSFVVVHDAFQYFEHRFEVPAAGAITESDAAQPSPARIATLRDAARNGDVTCVFTEPQFNPGLVDSVIPGGAEISVLDPLGTGLEPGPGLYPRLLERLAEALAACAG